MLETFSESRTRAECHLTRQISDSLRQKVGKLEPIVKAYEFLSTGSGSKKDIIPQVQAMLLNLAGWCEDYHVRVGKLTD